MLDQAIDRAHRAGEIQLLEAVVRFPGYRRQLLARFDRWTRAEWTVDGASPDESPVGVEEFAVYRHYRATLEALGAEDAEGWSVALSKALPRQPPLELRKPGRVVFVDPTALSDASWRLIDHCSKKARSVIVTLPFDPDPALADLYSSLEPTRKRLLDSDFIEEPDLIDGWLVQRKTGLAAVERELFRSDLAVSTTLKVGQDDGLRIVGGPAGSGVALLAAREVRQALESGVEPEEILIVAQRLDEETERIREILLSWGLPVDRAKSSPLATIPAISALRLAFRLPVDGWETSRLIRLIRNVQVRWEPLDEGPKSRRFEAASAIRLTRVFRDRDALIAALRRAVDDPKSRNPHARVALRVIEPLVRKIEAIAVNGAGRDQVDRLRTLAEFLGLEPLALEPLWDALDDQGWVRERSGSAIEREILSWAEFARQVDVTAGAIVVPRPEPEPGTIRIESVAGSSGARAKVVILTNLAERTFPSASAIDLDTSTDRVSPAYAREMFRFAQVAGSAEERLVLAFPTSDSKGEKLLPAGFLDDLIRRLDPDSARTCVERRARLNPVLLGHEDLVRSPGDAQVYAVARACARDANFSKLRALAGRPEHAEALRGTADAFEVAQQRRVGTAFGSYDGWLQDPRAIAKIRDKFGPDHTFSPSQLESFALCPFQFYQRYVLGLKLADEREEFEEDYAGRGEDIHRVLEQVHRQIEAEGATNLIERLDILIETQMRVELESHDGQVADVASILRDISTRRTRKILARYVGQFRDYAKKAGASSTPHRFEVEFGQRDESDDPADGLPHLAIGEGDSALKLQGKIDRIDLVHLDGEIQFRVIDYKTGAKPASNEVNAGLASQLPLYALAVEKLVFEEGAGKLADFGYWSLRDKGFTEVKLKGGWETYRVRLMDFVLDLVANLRRGTFPVDSQKKDCRSRCDFQAACRVGEVRFVGKKWDDRPTLEAEE